MDPLQQSLDELYGAPLEEFTAKRNEIVRKLRVAGDRDLAEAVRGLAKPSVAAWAVNQLAFQHADDIAALMDSGERLRQVQEWLLRREADPHDLRAAVEAERAAVGRLMGAARDLLEGSGRRAGPAVLERVAETLHAAAADAEVRDLVERGRLVEDRAAIGIGGLAGLSNVPRPEASPTSRSRPRRSGRDEAAEAQRRAAELRADLEKAEAEARAATGRSKATEREAQRAQADVVAAETALAGAEATLDQARAQLAEAERAAATARADAEAAESMVDSLRERTRLEDAT